jgi:hypothetical protein
MTIAAGNFEITITPMPPDESPQGAPVGRSLLIKQYFGELEAVSRGQMLAVMGQSRGSAGYVAMEFVSGSLNGRRGNFALQHFGTMDHGTPELRVCVVPDSGSDELKGLSGTFVIDITEGKHTYRFDYSLAP